MQRIYLAYSRLISSVRLDYHRYLYDKVNWDNKLIAIKGPKGVGKTTMILQHIKEAFPDSTKALYASLDNMWFSAHSISELAEYHYTHGGTHIFFDEVHKYKTWAQELKNIYDSYPNMHIVVTGSSLLQLEEAMKHDLSRRCRVYELQGLSLREYIKIEGKGDFPVVTLDDITRSHFAICTEITSKICVLPLFEKYIKEGYYPFYNEEGDGYYDRIAQVANTIIETDIPAVSALEYETLQKAKHLLNVLAEMVSFTLNVASLTSSLGISRNSLLKLFDLLCQARLTHSIYTCKSGMKQQAKPDKILFDNTNLIYALASSIDSGTVRETFFCNQVGHSHKLAIPEHGDCLVDDEMLFEIGGRRKSFNQINDKTDSYVVADGIEVGMGNKIPLWLFGFLY